MPDLSPTLYPDGLKALSQIEQADAIPELLHAVRDSHHTAVTIYRNSKKSDGVYLRVCTNFWSREPKIYLELANRYQSPLLVSAAGFWVLNGPNFFQKSEKINFPLMLHP